MKKGKALYLRLIIIMFIIIMIPYFQNAGSSWWSKISFYFMSGGGITGIYLYLITFGIIEGVLITLYIQSLLKDIKEQEPTKFELNQ